MQPEDSRSCAQVRTSLIRDWDALDERNLIVYETGGRPYHVELAQTCFGVDFEVMLGFYDRRGDGRICGYGLDRVVHLLHRRALLPLTDLVVAIRE